MYGTDVPPPATKFKLQGHCIGVALVLDRRMIGLEDVRNCNVCRGTLQFCAIVGLEMMVSKAVWTGYACS